MGKIAPRVCEEIGFDLLPVVVVVADLLAVHAQGHKTLQLAHLSKRLFQIRYPLMATQFQILDPLSAMQPREKLRSAHGLAEEIVHSCRESSQDIPRRIARRKQHDVHIVVVVLRHGPDRTADIQPIEMRHFPV